MTGTDLTVFHNLPLASQQIILEIIDGSGWEDLVQFVGNAVNLLSPDGISLAHTDGIVGSCLEIHIDLVFREAAGHQLTITTQDVSAIGLNTYTVTFQT